MKKLLAILLMASFSVAVVQLHPKDPKEQAAKVAATAVVSDYDLPKVAPIEVAVPEVRPVYPVERSQNLFETVKKVKKGKPTIRADNSV